MRHRKPRSTEAWSAPTLWATSATLLPALPAVRRATSREAPRPHAALPLGSGVALLRPAMVRLSWEARHVLQFVPQLLGWLLLFYPIYHIFRTLGKILVVAVVNKTCSLRHYIWSRWYLLGERSFYSMFETGVSQPLLMCERTHRTVGPNPRALNDALVFSPCLPSTVDKFRTLITKQSHYLFFSLSYLSRPETENSFLQVLMC